MSAERERPALSHQKWSGAKSPVAAIVHGYRTFDPDVDVAGVILNRVGSEAHAALLREALPDISVLGALPPFHAQRIGMYSQGLRDAGAEAIGLDENRHQRP